MASCETTRFLASVLDFSNDRIAIICTNSISAENQDLRTILPLSSANPRRIKATVDTIVSSSEKPRSQSLDAAVRSARALLEQSTPQDLNSDLSPNAFGHIFALTANSNGLPEELLKHDKIQLHLICAGSVPWKGERKVRCNGWQLQSKHTSALQAVTRNKDHDQSSLFNRLKTLISEAREGTLHGTLNNIVLDISPGPHCSIEGIIGRKTVPTIQHGEQVTVLMRLMVGCPTTGGYSLMPDSQRACSSPLSNDLDTAFDKLLGTAPATVLTAKLRYQHSLLPTDTRCTSSKICRMRRQTPQSDWDDLPANRAPAASDNALAEVQKLFAFHIATSCAPRQAMMILIEDFGDGGRRSACADYIQLLLAELKFQARIIERFDLSEYRSGPVAVSRDLRHDVYGLEHFGHGLFDASNYKPQAWISDEMMMIPPTSLSPSESGAGNCMLKDRRVGSLGDERPRVRNDLRRLKGSENMRPGGGKGRSLSMGMEDETRGFGELAMRKGGTKLD